MHLHHHNGFFSNLAFAFWDLFFDSKKQSHLFPQLIKRKNHLPLSLVKYLFYCDEELFDHYDERTHIDNKKKKKSWQKKKQKINQNRKKRGQNRFKIPHLEVQAY
jgi:hypothetical protein